MADRCKELEEKLKTLTGEDVQTWLEIAKNSSDATVEWRLVMSFVT